MTQWRIQVERDGAPEQVFQPQRFLRQRFLHAYTRLTIQAIKLIIGAAIGLAMVAVIMLLGLFLTVNS